MPKIKDIIGVNTQATLARGVQLSDYYNPEKADVNDRLAVGYVFGNAKSGAAGTAANEVSSLTVFEKIRDSLNGIGSHNIFTVIARYGHGKSHFALVLANYFGLPANSPVLKEIVEHIEACSDPGTAGHFRNFKKNNKPLLVLTIAGHEIRDLRQGVLQALRRALDSKGCGNYTIKAVSTKAAEWLEGLDEGHRKKAEEILAEEFRMDFEALVDELKKFNVEKEQIARELSKRLYNVPVDFGAEVSLKNVLTQAVTDLCEGPDAPFSKMLILFDELGVYSMYWSSDRIQAGNLAPQELIEACFDKPRKLCLVGFVQRELGDLVRDHKFGDECMKWAKRLPQETHYRLVSNLEEVISKLVLPSEKAAWEKVVRDNAPALHEEAEFARSSFADYQNWDKNHFYSVVARDCFPLHPLTTGILCRLDFAQGSRTTIEAVNLLIREHESKEVTENGRLNWIPAIELVEIFKNDFQQSSSEYQLYSNAVATIGNNEDTIYYDVLKALFLFFQGKLKREKTADHAELLARLAGHDEKAVKDALDYLAKEYGVIRFSAANREYNFTAVGNNSVELLKKLRTEIVGETLDGIKRQLAGSGILERIDLPSSVPTSFIREFAVKGDEWVLAPTFLDAADFNLEKLKQVCKDVRDTSDAMGVAVYLLADDAEKLSTAVEDAEDLLETLKSTAFPYPVVVGIPNVPAAQIGTWLLLRNKLSGLSKADQDKYGQSYDEAVARVEEELNTQLTEHLSSTHLRFAVSPSTRTRLGGHDKDLEEISNEIFSEFYPDRPPVLSDSLKTNGNKGNTVAAEIARQMVTGSVDLKTFDNEKQTVVRTVLMEGKDKWGIIDASGRIQEPKNPKVKHAWSELLSSIQEDVPTTFALLIQKLSQPPYGLDQYTSTLLLAAFIGKHRYELSFAENGKAIKLFDIQEKLSQRAKKFIEWLKKGTVTLTHAGRSNRERAERHLEELGKTKNPAELKRLSGESADILETLPPGDELRTKISERLKEIQSRLEKHSKNQDKANQIRAQFRDSEDLAELCEFEHGLVQLADSDPESVFAEGLAEVRRRIEAVANKHATLPLTRIEAYTAIRDKIEKSRAAAESAGREDIEDLLAKAIVRVDREYKTLKAAEEEAPILAQIEAMHANGHLLPLSYYLADLDKLAGIEASSDSPRIKDKAEAKRKKIEDQIQGLRRWAQEVPSRALAVTDLAAGSRLRDEILGKQNIYAGTPEAADLSDAIEKVEERIKELQEAARQAVERRREAEEAERKRRAAEREKEHAREITKQFAGLSDPAERFNCLLDLVQHGKAGLNKDQIAALVSALEQ